MFSLIIVLVSIALVVALALATLYFGGDSHTKAQTKATAAALNNQGVQIAAAGHVAVAQGSSWPAAAGPYFSQPYISGMPTPPARAYKTGTPTATDWVYYVPGETHFALPQKISKAVCLAVNQTVGINGIPAAMTGNSIIECFGPSEPYTYFYDPAASVGHASAVAKSVADANAAMALSPVQTVASDSDTPGTPTATTTASPGYPLTCPSGNIIASGSCKDTSDQTFVNTEIFAGDATGGAAFSAYKAVVGQTAWGMLISPPNRSTKIYVPVSSQPLPAPPGWTPMAAQSIHPMPPPVASTYYYWPSIVPYPAGTVGYPKLYTDRDGPGQIACDKLAEGKANTGPLTYIGYVSNSYYGCSGRWFGSMEPSLSAGGASTWEACPTGYSPTASGQPRCTPDSFLSVPKPADGVCYYFRSVGSNDLTMDPMDTDCTGTGGSSTQVAISGKNAANSCSASDPSGGSVKIEASGRVTLTQYYGSCGGQVTKTCSATSTNVPGYYSPAQMGAMTCN